MPDSNDMAQANRVSVTIAGHRHEDWLRYSVDSDFFTPADGWEMSLGIPAAKLPGWLRPWADVQVRVGDDLVMTGRIDSLRRRASKSEYVLELTGRDRAAVLLDCSAPLYVRREATLPEVCATVARPLGVTRQDIRQGKTPFKKITVEPGMTAWEAVQQAAEASGLWPWFTPDGTLRVAAPDYTAPASAELTLDTGDASVRNNVLSLSVEEGVERRYSEVTVLGQSTGDEFDESQTTIRATEKDAACAYYRPFIQNGGNVDSVDAARVKARKLLADGVMDSLTVTARVRGHRITKPGAGQNAGESGPLWEPGMRVRVCAPPLGLDADMFLARRTFQGGRDGITTTLTLKPWGVWLPDSSQGVKPRKKSDDGGGLWEL